MVAVVVVLQTRMTVLLLQLRRLGLRLTEKVYHHMPRGISEMVSAYKLGEDLLFGWNFKNVAMESVISESGSHFLNGYISRRFVQSGKQQTGCNSEYIVRKSH